MGGPGSGHGIKRPDHSANSGSNHMSRQLIKNQRPHLKSLFSDLPDPSCHAHKKERDRLIGIKEEPMKELRRQVIAMEYKDMQDAARKRVEKAMRKLDQILESEDTSDSAALAAINTVLDRAYGKAATTNFNVNTSVDSNPSELTDHELRKRIDENLKGLERASEEEQGENRPTSIRKYN